jgi:hypothetical protein
MDIQYLRIILLGLHNIQDCPQPRTEAVVDAYYQRHALVERLYPKAGPFVVALVVGLVSIGLWQWRP